jgi:hypothetical protein
VGVPRPRGLQLEEHLDFVRRSWRAERIGTWALVLLLGAAASGLLGSGPLSRGVATVPDVLRVDFPRFSRYQSAEKMAIHVAPSTVPSGREVRLSLDRAYLEDVRIETMVPAPVRSEAAADSVIFVFAVADATHAFTLSIGLQPERIGFIRGRVGLERAGPASTLTFHQLVYP